MTRGGLRKGQVETSKWVGRRRKERLKGMKERLAGKSSDGSIGYVCSRCQAGKINILGRNLLNMNVQIIFFQFQTLQTSLLCFITVVKKVKLVHSVYTVRNARN